MKALVLEKAGVLSLREIAIEETLGPRDVRIAVCNVGICGSDLHYYAHGAIGQFVLREPMVLGYEASARHMPPTSVEAQIVLDAWHSALLWLRGRAGCAALVRSRAAHRRGGRRRGG